ncbi:MAG: hypothetical protein HZA93_10270 [Verrucomicrobia bacterium]|nr:hypothetical protein [Verrucomicrobiota bacterium]
MKTVPSPSASAEPHRQLIELWAANLALPDVKLAPFMPARLIPLDCPKTDHEGERVLRLIERAQGKRLGIIL